MFCLSLLNWKQTPQKISKYHGKILSDIYISYFRVTYDYSISNEFQREYSKELSNIDFTSRITRVMPAQGIAATKEI